VGLLTHYFYANKFNYELYVRCMYNNGCRCVINPWPLIRFVSFVMIIGVKWCEVV
jgi:hypothetical protein